MTDRNPNDGERHDSDGAENAAHGRYEHSRSEHSSYEEWDAAYVLGALSSAERHEFEEHLSGCPRCASAVAELAALPGLLGTLPAVDAFAMLEADALGSETSEPPPRGILSRLIARVGRRRRVRVWTTTLVGVAAAAAIATAFVLPAAVNVEPHATVSVSLQQLVPSPISASVQLTEAKWGTTIAMTCRYSTVSSGQATSGYQAQGRYGLYVTDRDGTTMRVSSWAAGPGAVVHAAGTIDTPVSQIARVELRSLDADAVLLSHTIG